MPPHFLCAWVRCSWACLDIFVTSVAQVLYHAQGRKSYLLWTQFCLALMQKLGGSVKALCELDTTFSVSKHSARCTVCSSIAEQRAAVRDDKKFRSLPVSPSKTSSPTLGRDSIYPHLRPSQAEDDLGATGKPGLNVVLNVKVGWCACKKNGVA